MYPGRGGKRRLCKRYDIAGHAHYLTFSCWRCQPLLSASRARTWLLDAVDKARSIQGFDLWAWVIMPEHVHLLILPHDGARISAILSSVKQPVAKKAVFQVRRHRPGFLPRMEDRQPSGRRSYRFWQPGGGYDRNIWTAEELHEKAAYIHANPVRRGLVESPEDWPWSSWRAWAQDVDEPIRIDRESMPPIQR